MTQPVMVCGTLASANLVYVKFMRIVRDGNRHKVCVWFNDMDIDDEGVPLKWFDTQIKAREWLGKIKVTNVEVSAYKPL